MKQKRVTALMFPISNLCVNSSVTGYPGKPAGTAELNVTFHQKPSQVFSNRPIQGSCAGSTKENQSLVLEIIGKGASPQNRRVLARYKLETHIDVEKDVNAIVVNGNPGRHNLFFMYVFDMIHL